MNIENSPAAARVRKNVPNRWRSLANQFGLPIVMQGLGLARRLLPVPNGFSKRFVRGVQLALSLALIGLLVCAGISTNHALMTAARTQIASELVMHSQRLGKAAPNAIQGNPAAFRQLEQSREAINLQLGVLTSGGNWQGRTMPEAESAEQERMAAIRSAWLKSDKAAAQILSMEKELTGFRTTLRTLNTISPVLLEISEQIASLLADRKSTRLNSSHVSESRMPSSA